MTACRVCGKLYLMPPVRRFRKNAGNSRLLDGKRIKDCVTLWVRANVSVRGLARQLGYVETIERAGGVVTQDLCVILSRPEDLGFKSLATNSAKMAFFAPGSNRIPTWYGSLQQCLEAALRGRWPAAA